MALSDNLISYWSLEEASGTRADAVVASANDLTDNNTVTGNPGKIANAAQFTAANSESLTRADNASLSLGNIDFTFTAWVYGDTLPTNAGVLSKRAGATNTIEHYIGVNASAQITFGVGDGASEGIVTASTFGALSTATWYFIAAYHDSVNNLISVAINAGTPNTLSWTTGVQDIANAFAIGRRFTAGQFWNGRIDEVGFWKRVLTGAEITELYNAGSGRDYAYIAGAVAGQPTALRYTLFNKGIGRGIA